MKTDIITIGNAVMDLFLVVHDANVSMRLNKELNELCVKAGEKIEVDNCDVCLGGNAANAAVGLARSSIKTGLVAEIGDDEFAQKIEGLLQKEMVDTTYLKKTKNAASSMTIGINFQGERTLFVKHVKRLHDFQLEEIETSWVYLTSLGNEWKTPYQHIVEYVSKTKARLAFNPGTLQVNAGYEEIKSVMQVADILFLNRDEGEKIVQSVSAEVAHENFLVAHAKEQETKTRDLEPANSHNENFVGSPRLEVRELLIRLQKMGSKVVVITDGKQGSYVLDESGKMWFLDIFPSHVVEKTGAGDAFASGFMSGVLSGVSIQESMRWGTANAASVIGKVGSQAGLLTKEQYKEMLINHQAIQLKQI